MSISNNPTMPANDKPASDQPQPAPAKEAMPVKEAVPGEKPADK